MAKHAKQPNWWLLGILCAVCIMAGVAVSLVAVYLPRIVPAEGGAFSYVSTPTVSSAPPTVTTAMEEITTTTTQAKYQALSITSHKKNSTTDEPFTVFRGTSDPDSPLTVNGQEVARDAVGAFAIEMSLQPGQNTFTFSHLGKNTVYTVTYNYIILRNPTPAGSQRYSSGSAFTVSVQARVGSTVTATFNGATIALQRDTALGGDEEIQFSDHFTTYAGSFTLPSDNIADINMGKVAFSATCGGQTATLSSGTIICEKAVKPVIGEIVAFSAETFDGDTSDDASRPTNNYLPQGTVDYVVGRAYYGDIEYLKLRCGRRVYVSKKVGGQNATVTKQYAGALPEHNRLSVASLRETEACTTLTLNTEWKAPFLLDLLPQQYTDPSVQDYTVDAVTCKYVQITFCYATNLEGEITFARNNPLFSRAAVTKSGENTILRLYLQREGEFYGWDASYNDEGQLEFYFLHPAQAEPADNAYGASLKGIRIMLDVGHSTNSGGAVGLDPQHPEEERNLYLARMLKTELESMGATVILNREETPNLDVDQRCLALKKAKPNLCIAIHHDSSGSTGPNGFGSFHSTLFSAKAAKCIYDRTIAANIYDADADNNRNRLAWHYYFVARMSDCPVVLTENGFMSSPLDHVGIVSEAVNRQKAQAIAQGVADYFLSIRIPNRQPLATTTTTTATTTTTTTTGSTTTSTDTTVEDTTATLPTVTDPAKETEPTEATDPTEE